MICLPCVDAGAKLTALKTQPHLLKGLWTREGLLTTAALLHDECEAPTTCSCQHEVTLDALKAARP